MTKVVKILITLFFVVNGYASSLPENCNLIGIKTKQLVLKGKKERLVFIHNISNMDVYLTRISVDDPGAQAGWTTRINKQRWSVVKLDEASLVFQCIEYRPGHEQLTSCQNIIYACQLEPQEKPINDVGSYWVAENMSLSSALQKVGSRGFQLIKHKSKKESGDL